ncbi:MAG: hypothetical protein ACRDYC_13070 [Acidimicrobiales bacterium]
MIPLTAEQYQAEPADKVELFIRFTALDAAVEAEVSRRPPPTSGHG